ncbi:hypothetical protein DQK91_09035 [Oceanidesulfovibrio marinus]|uniref:Uncharacterized protein n=2 Tax=Oceanidesulfovibrio marinus TaxID=370038 RepID=A0A6P1ZHQ1_9BACT|nr:hypothetical protein DQK91_09035 [Oceanidesulfovibrio marinus]
MRYHIVYDAEGIIRSQIGDTGDGQAEAHADRVLAQYPGGGVLIANAPADANTQMVRDGQLVARPAPARLLSAYEFKERFTVQEQAIIMTSPELAPLALHVLTAPARLLSAYEFKERFTVQEQAIIMTSPELAPLALHVLTAPNGVDVTDATAQQARTALAAAGWSAERLDAIFAAPA